MWNPRGETVVNLQAEMHAWFEDNLAQLTAAGIARQRIALDPGVGYAKNSDVAQDLAMMNTIGHLQDLQRPVMTAVSNKGWAKFLLGCQSWRVRMCHWWRQQKCFSVVHAFYVCMMYNQPSK